MGDRVTDVPSEGPEKESRISGLKSIESGLQKEQRDEVSLPWSQSDLDEPRRLHGGEAEVGTTGFSMLHFSTDGMVNTALFWGTQLCVYILRGNRLGVWNSNASTRCWAQRTKCAWW